MLHLLVGQRQQVFSASGLCRLPSCGQSGASAKDGHAARPCSSISSADCTRQRRPIGARLHGATACSRDLRRSQLPDPATLCNCKERRRTCWISRISANKCCVIRERPSGSEKAKSGPQIKDSACSFLSCSIFHGIGQ